MKRILHLALFFGLLFVLNPSDAVAQCEAGSYAEACIPKLKQGFNFVKSYKIDGEGGSKKKIEYSYVFAKGTQYMINMCTGTNDADGIVVSLYDSNRQLVSTNNANGKLYSTIAYPCNATGIYYITFTFNNSNNNCGGAVLGFKR
ncbi:hypothetical protein OO013_03105 [Mangrovivirga sp. M17]|uniref:Pre-peptidase C-terminal domain-containing protein n=2 Tax=Mangrovivirga TaxID=2858886 RepID=A0A4D7JFG2_9BACT|nr:MULTISPECIES: hypothetical protein [Mangrovivirga]MCX2742837.1 hypothetical protein [Mangrovivirga halotolerans]QCK14391.1 hypothetical protein DCC35_06375 [Mangrovivirga cuniculi]